MARTGFSHLVIRSAAVTTVIVAVTMISSCAAEEDSIAAVTTTFNRWNDLARSGDPEAARFICDNPPVEDAYTAPILARHRGFAVPGELNVQVNDDTATVDFLDAGTHEEGDDTDVFINLVKENGGWRVCRSQITAPGGIG